MKRPSCLPLSRSCKKTKMFPFVVDLSLFVSIFTRGLFCFCEQRAKVSTLNEMSVQSLQSLLIDAVANKCFQAFSVRKAPVEFMFKIQQLERELNTIPTEYLPTLIQKLSQAHVTARQNNWVTMTQKWAERVASLNTIMKKDLADCKFCCKMCGEVQPILRCDSIEIELTSDPYHHEHLTWSNNLLKRCSLVCEISSDTSFLPCHMASTLHLGYALGEEDYWRTVTQHCNVEYRAWTNKLQQFDIEQDCVKQLTCQFCSSDAVYKQSQWFTSLINKSQEFVECCQGELEGARDIHSFCFESLKQLVQQVPYTLTMTGIIEFSQQAINNSQRKRKYTDITTAHTDGTVATTTVVTQNEQDNNLKTTKIMRLL